MNLGHELYIQSIFLGAGLSFLIGIAQLFIRVRILKNYMLMLTGICISIVLLYFWYTQSLVVDLQMNVMALHVPALFFMGPALFFFAKAALDEDYRLKKIHLVNFAPGVAALLYAIVTWFTGDYRVEYFKSFFKKESNHLNEYLMAMAFILNSLYYAWLIKDTAFFYRAEAFRQESTVRYMVALILLSFALTLVAFFAILLRNITLLSICVATITGIVSISLIIVFRSPEFFQVLQEIVQQQKYKRSLLGDIDLGQLARRIDRLMNEEKIFTDEELSLNSLARQLELSPHQLSEYLNKELSKNFASFINEYRIREAKKLLLSDSEDTILSIAYKVGFNSKSTFNAVFMKFVGQSPTLFKGKTLKES